MIVQYNMPPAETNHALSALLPREPDPNQDKST